MLKPAEVADAVTTWVDDRSAGRDRDGGIMTPSRLLDPLCPVVNVNAPGFRTNWCYRRITKASLAPTTSTTGHVYAACQRRQPAHLEIR
jgi:hypothetical protein